LPVMAHNETDLLNKVAIELGVPTGKRDSFTASLFALLTKVGASRNDKLELPDKAPKLYADRPEGQGIIAFLQDEAGWGRYVAKGVLSRVDLTRLDPKASIALANWLRKNELPADMTIPTKKEVTDRNADTPRPGDRPARVEWALRRRRQRANRPQ
jgi:hypothetical protein